MDLVLEVDKENESIWVWVFLERVGGVECGVKCVGSVGVIRG